MVPAEILQRVYFVRCSDSGTGTAFTIVVDGREYLASARHVMNPAHSPRVVRMMRLQRWEELPLAGIWSPNDPEIDVSVMSLTQPLPNPPLRSIPSLDGSVWSQDTFFLGFPYGRHSGETVLHAGHPVPFTKKATLSGMTKDRNGRNLIWLDGHCNKGFSGGPMAFRPSLAPHDSRQVAIGGVIYSAETLPSPVHRGAEETDMSVRTDTGFAFAHDIAYAVEGARALANGPAVPAGH